MADTQTEEFIFEYVDANGVTVILTAIVNPEEL